MVLSTGDVTSGPDATLLGPDALPVMYPRPRRHYSYLPWPRRQHNVIHGPDAAHFDPMPFPSALTATVLKANQNHPRPRRHTSLAPPPKPFQIHGPDAAILGPDATILPLLGPDAKRTSLHGPDATILPLHGTNAKRTSFCGPDATILPLYGTNA